MFSSHFSVCPGFGYFTLVFELKISLICVYNKNIRPSADWQAARPFCRIVGRSKQSCRRAARRAARVYIRSVHVHQTAEPFSPTSSAPLHAHVPTTNQENVRIVLPLSRETAAVRRAQKLASFYSGALAISLFISGATLYSPSSKCKKPIPHYVT